MKKVTIIILLALCISCKKETKEKNAKYKVVTTTTMITDLVKNIGGDLIEVEGLMGSGVDPHLYKASEGDVSKLLNADAIFYNGLHLEGKLVEVFDKMRKQNTKTIAVAESLDTSSLIRSEYFASNYDPHIWFHIDLWTDVAQFTTQKLKELDPINAEAYDTNGQEYIKKLTALKTKITNIINSLPKEKRILITAHDAFNYFGQQYNFEVVGLQGLSTATEAGVKDVQRLASFIIDNQVKAIFVESSVPKRTIEALQAAVISKGHAVAIGGTLYSDALGNPGTVEGTYIGMFSYNVETIIKSLK